MITQLPLAQGLALNLARAQFGFTIAFHIMFPAFSIGLASFLAVLEAGWLITRKPMSRQACATASRPAASMSLTGSGMAGNGGWAAPGTRAGRRARQGVACS